MIKKSYLDGLTYEIIDGAIEVHKIMGSGLLENVYHQCMKEEFLNRRINFLTELKVPVVYKGKMLNIDFRCDLFVNGLVVVELKCVQQIIPLHEAQLITYMKLLKCPKGILLNFNCSNMFKEGQKTFVNEYFSALPNE